MNRLIASVAVLILLFSLGGRLAAEEKESTIKRAVKDIVSDTINAGKDLVGGAKEGINEGRGGGNPSDPIIISNKDGLPGRLTVEVLKVEELAAERFQVTVALRNLVAVPVRLVNLNGLGNVVLLDAAGFASPLAKTVEQASEVTVLADSATRARFVFDKVEGRPKFFRLFNLDYPVPAK